MPCVIERANVGYSSRTGCVSLADGKGVGGKGDPAAGGGQINAYVFVFFFILKVSGGGLLRGGRGRGLPVRRARGTISCVLARAGRPDRWTVVWGREVGTGKSMRRARDG